MITNQYLQSLADKSVIRTLSEWSTARGAEIGYDNVFDYSLGNPSVPCPPQFTAALERLLQTQEPVALHGYSPSQSLPSVRAAVAENLRRRFGIPYTAAHIFMTCGAAGALAHALRCVAAPGQEVITFAPYFPEYKPYVEGAGLVLKVVPPRTADFQIDFDALERQLTPNTAAILVNTPNNPSGAAYSAATLTRLAGVLAAASQKWGHIIFLISDEPYREILFGGKTVDYVAKFYPHTLTCYSFSKSLSLPGERIGYLAANPACEMADKIVPICAQISRGIGHNCPASSIQLAVAECLEQTSDLTVYEKNMELLYAKLVALGFRVQKPGGTFYIFPQSPEPDAVAFSEKAKKYDLALVPGDSFGCPGYFRMAYCISTEKVQRSLPALEKLMHTEYPR
ncbi:MAG: pyridoxal phosphate-dependent aminotransferase [Gemmiger sp.]|nr:pyridoxal phosphate-dependent aminotransferase [Gemmiger sp.]